MCGINGIIYKIAKPDFSEIHQMNQAIKHRGPDDEGIYRYKNTILGHVRLSILDLSKKGKQPMSNDGRFWIIYNGEIYNFRKIKKELIDLGHKFYSETDTEVILCAFKEWGIKSLHKFNGMWSFAILDIKNNNLLISRDRYGVKPCYYYNDGNKFIFSSEIKGIISSKNEFNIDKYKVIVSNKDLEKSFTTIYKNLDIVPPGCLFEINLNTYKINITRWWKGLENFPKIDINIKSIKERLRELLFDATKKRLISDVKIATSLSGGIDSSIIFSILNNLDQKNKNEKIDLNPFIIDYKKNKTIEDAIKLSKLFNKEPIIVKYDENSIESFADKLSTIEITAPYFSQLELYKAQNIKGFKVSIDGHGADECLGGYNKDIENFGMYYQNSLADSLRAILNLKGDAHLKKTINRLNLSPDFHSFNIDINQFIETKNIPNDYIESKKLELIHPFLKEDMDELNNYDFPLQILYLNATFGHMQWLLNKWDKASMASSVEIRSPFLDWQFFQYALAVPAILKTRNGKNKSILRDIFKDMLPQYILDKNFKQGLPIVDFRKDDIALNLINETINQSDFKTSNIWDSQKIIFDFNNVNNRAKKINQILNIVRIYLMNKGFKEKKEKAQNTNKIFKESFNKLN
tara:strand:- start:17 stop:1915 length:1899 start_codon:yes stop_codon:yes gene_type:complete